MVEQSLSWEAILGREMLWLNTICHDAFIVYVGYFLMQVLKRKRDLRSWISLSAVAVPSVQLSLKRLS